MPVLSSRLSNKLRSFILGTVLAATTAVRPGIAAPSLLTYNVSKTQTSVSGISSGAYMAVQFGTAWSSIIKGVGAIAGGPFGCSEGSGSAALSTCMVGMPAVDLRTLIGRTDSWSSGGAIDKASNLATQKIYLFNGYNDSVVARSVGNALNEFYLHYQPTSKGNIFYQTAIGAGHSQVTLAFGGKCSENGGVYINRCDYDQAGVILQHIYGVLQPRNSGALTGQLLTFGQGDFTTPKQPVDDSMDDTGFVYVPSSCATNEPCRLHIALHGCLQSSSNIGQDFVRHAGYNEWADTNHIIVLYPQTRPLGLTNPQACWDWWGYLDKDPTVTPTYLLKSGQQIQAIKAMVDRVAQDAVAPPALVGAGPTAPATVLAPDHSDTAIDVVWSSTPAAATYDVFRADTGTADFQQIGVVSGLSYGDAGLKPATQYRYKVRASSADGSSPFSPVVSVATVKRVPKCDDPGQCATR
jgi:poly(3-hydroxybutyrate) depolymerase